MDGDWVWRGVHAVHVGGAGGDAGKDCGRIYAGPGSDRGGGAAVDGGGGVSVLRWRAGDGDGRAARRGEYACGAGGAGDRLLGGGVAGGALAGVRKEDGGGGIVDRAVSWVDDCGGGADFGLDRKSTRLNSSHA